VSYLTYRFRCIECNAAFEASRSDAKVCSQRCHQRRHKRRKEARLRAEGLSAFERFLAEEGSATERLAFEELARRFPDFAALNARILAEAEARH
jgi:predicted nucleic acid-binding Zn ribbon protein